MSLKKPKLGQNFLIDPTARRRIVDALGDISTNTVLEIGPGRGALTDLLSQRARYLIAVELDRAFAPRLTEMWKAARNVAILQGDILELDLATVQSRSGFPDNGSLVVVGNLPYYITSDILLRLFEQAGSIRRAVVMVQEEVADRLVARCGTSAYGLLSATTQVHARVEKLFALPAEAFSPAPSVTSAVVRMEMCPRFAELKVERGAFLRFLQICFRQKRKTLANNLKTANVGATADIRVAIESAYYDPAVRAEAVSLDGMAKIYRYLASNEKASDPAVAGEQ